jgi:GT2 family glycosyltransferase
MKYQDKIGIITVLYKSETVIVDFFKSLNDQIYNNIVLYVIDNKSPDKSLAISKELAKSSFFTTKFIENDNNYGLPKGYNQGTEASIRDNCEYVLLSNNDIILQPDTIEKLYQGLKDYNADMVVPKIYYYGTNIIWAAGGKFSKHNRSVVHFGINKNDTGQYDKCYKIDFAPACFMLIKKDVFISVGLLDEKYFVYYEDVDFIYRTSLKSYKLFYIYNSTIEHKESTSTGKLSDFSIYHVYRNRIYFARKFYRSWRLFYVMEKIYHNTLRRIKLINNHTRWVLVGKAIKDGYRL